MIIAQYQPHNKVLFKKDPCKIGCGSAKKKVPKSAGSQHFSGLKYLFHFLHAQDPRRLSPLKCYSRLHHGGGVFICSTNWNLSICLTIHGKNIRLNGICVALLNKIKFFE